MLLAKFFVIAAFAATAKGFLPFLSSNNNGYPNPGLIPSLLGLGTYQQIPLEPELQIAPCQLYSVWSPSLSICVKCYDDDEVAKEHVWSERQKKCIPVGLMCKTTVNAVEDVWDWVSKSCKDKYPLRSR